MIHLPIYIPMRSYYIVNSLKYIDRSVIIWSFFMVYEKGPRNSFKTVNKTQQSNLLVIHAFKAYFSKIVNHHLISGDYHCPHFIIVKILYVACFVRILGEVFCHHFATKIVVLFFFARQKLFYGWWWWERWLYQQLQKSKCYPT